MLRGIANKSRRIQREIRNEADDPDGAEPRSYPVRSERMYMEKVLNGGKRKYVRKGAMKLEVQKFIFW